MHAKNLPPELLAIHSRVNAGLNLWGQSANKTAKASHIKWLEKYFRHWKYRALGPFICPKMSFEPFRKIGEDIYYEGYFYSFDDIMIQNYIPENRALENTGYLIYATSIGGDHLVIDTRRGDQLTVKRIYMPEMGEKSLNPGAVYLTGCSIATLYQYMAEEREGPTF